MNTLVIWLMIASFTSGMVWMKIDKIYDYFLPPATEQVQEEKKDDNYRMVLVPVAQQMQPSVQPKPTGNKSSRREREREDLFCTATTGPARDTKL